MKPNADYLGIISSFLCLLHCLALPLVAGVQAVSHGSGLWEYFDYVFLVFTFIAVLQAARPAHVLPLVKLMFATFFVLLAAAISLEHFFPVLEYVAYVASVGLIFTHFFNLKHTRCACHA